MKVTVEMTEQEFYEFKCYRDDKKHILVNLSLLQTEVLTNRFKKNKYTEQEVIIILDRFKSIVTGILRIEGEKKS